MTIYPKSYHYYNRYIKFIESRKNRSSLNKRIEKHHIIPRSMGGSDENDNIIKLTYREHFIAHWLLWKAFNNTKMIHAFWYMTQRKMHRLSSRVYESLKQSRLEALKGNKNASGKRSQKSKNKMSLAQLNTNNHSTRGKKRPEYSLKMSGKNNPMFGIVSPMKNKKHKIVVCPKCKKTGGGGAMSRFHFDNCKF